MGLSSIVSTSFERPVGAAADAKELEYITALHQTSHDDDEGFLDGSIEAEDVMHYLMSRYGIKTSIEDIQKRIFYDLAGGSSDDDCIDICEIVAILLIPFFVKSTQGDLKRTLFLGETETTLTDNIKRGFSSDSQLQSYTNDLNEIKHMFSKKETIEHVLKIILAESIGYTEDIHTKPVHVTPELIKAVLARYDETGLTQDEQLIQQMIQDVTGGDPDGVLDADSFAKALSDDVLLYDVSKETRVSTFYEDVFGTEVEISQQKKKNKEEEEENPLKAADDTNNDDNDDAENPSEKDNEPKFTNKFTFSQIDLMSDGMRSKTHITMAYLSFVFYVFRFGDTNYKPDPCPNNSFGCTIANNVTYFLLLMTFTMAYGVPFILTLSSGNSLRGRSYKNVFFGMVGIVVFLWAPYIGPFKFLFFNNTALFEENRQAEATFIKVFGYMIAYIHVALQAIHLARVIKPSLTHAKNRVISFLFTRGTVRETFLLKLSASLKTHKMVKNALDLHNRGCNSTPCNRTGKSFVSTNTNALLNYSRENDKTETVGGLIWCWKSYFSRSLIHKEGVMVNSRLVLCVYLQIMLAVLLCFIMPFYTYRNVRPNIFPALLHEVKECEQSTFDPDKCYIPSFGSATTGLAICKDLDFGENDGVCNGSKYPENIIKFQNNGTESSNNIISLLCEGIRNMNPYADGNLYELEVRSIQEFNKLAYEIIDVTLCEGLSSFNDTMWYSYDKGSPGPCQFNADLTCVPLDQDVLGDMEAAIAELMFSYQLKYRAVMNNTVDCLLNNQANSTVVENVLSGATDSLRSSLLHASESSWNLFFIDLPADDAMKTSFNDYVETLFQSLIGPERADELLEAYGEPFSLETMINQTLLVPEYTSDILLKEVSMRLVDQMFLKLNSTLSSATTAIASNGTELPSYVKFPVISPATVTEVLCQETYLVRENINLRIDSIGSTKDHYCRAHLTACSAGGRYCLLGMERIVREGNDLYIPYQFEGEKCYEYPEFKKIMVARDVANNIFAIVPSDTLINVSVSLALIVSILSLISHTALFLPNVILTLLKYRSGVLPTLRSPHFKNMRKNLLHLTFLVPVVFWSVFAMTFALYFIIWALTLFLFWNATSTTVVSLISIIVGVLITVGIKLLAIFFLNRQSFSAFYRKNPALANVVNVAFECWHIFLSIAFVISRAVILIFVSLLFIGRVDRTVLAEDIDLDRYPHVFRQAILASEAHRHPYIERLGMMYMMKLKHGENFGKRSNSIWRLLFVFALMPWLQKYRIADNVEDIDVGGLMDAYERAQKKDDEVKKLKNLVAKLSLKVEQNQMIEKSAKNSVNFSLVDDDDNDDDNHNDDDLSYDQGSDAGVESKKKPSSSPLACLY